MTSCAKKRTTASIPAWPSATGAVFFVALSVLAFFTTNGCRQNGKATASQTTDCASIPLDSAPAVVACFFDFDAAQTYTEPICMVTDSGGKIILGAKPDSTTQSFLIGRPDPNGSFEHHWPVLIDCIHLPGWTDESGYASAVYAVKDYRGYLLEVSVEAPFSPENRRRLARYFPCFQEWGLPQAGNFEKTLQHPDFTETIVLTEEREGWMFSYCATMRREGK